MRLLLYQHEELHTTKFARCGFYFFDVHVHRSCPGSELQLQLKFSCCYLPLLAVEWFEYSSTCGKHTSGLNKAMLLLTLGNIIMQSYLWNLRTLQSPPCHQDPFPCLGALHGSLNTSSTCSRSPSMHPWTRTPRSLSPSKCHEAAQQNMLSTSNFSRFLCLQSRMPLWKLQSLAAPQSALGQARQLLPQLRRSVGRGTGRMWRSRVGEPRRMLSGMRGWQNGVMGIVCGAGAPPAVSTLSCQNGMRWCW